MLFSYRIVLAALVTASLSAAAVAAPVAVTYTLDPDQSSLTASGTFMLGGNSFSIDSQSVGSLVTAYSGTITAQRDFAADTLAITGGTITAANSGSYEPPAGAPTPANYGTNSTIAAGVSVLGAVRNFVFSPSTTSTITSASSFDASLFSALINSGELDYVEESFAGSGGNGSASVAGDTVTTSGTATLTDAGGLETFTIPIDTTLTISLYNPDDLTMTLTGTLVATASTVPEPASLSLLLLSAAPLLLRRRRR